MIQVWRKRLTFASIFENKKKEYEKDNSNDPDAGMWHDGSDGAETCSDQV
jgi:hypothetical protein